MNGEHLTLPTEAFTTGRMESDPGAWVEVIPGETFVLRSIVPGIYYSAMITQKGGERVTAVWWNRQLVKVEFPSDLTLEELKQAVAVSVRITGIGSKP